MVPALGAAVGFAQDPDADRLAIVDETGRYIGEELTLALAASHRLAQATGPVVLNLSTSRATEDLAARFRLPGDPHAGRRDPRRRGDAGALGRPGRRGERRGDRPSGRVRPRQLRGDGPGPRPAGEVRSATLRNWSTTCRGTRWSRTSTRWADRRSRAAIADLFDRIAEAHPEARADRRDGLRLDWPDRWAHVRSSNTEPIVRVIAEAADLGSARALADELGRQVAAGRES